MSLVFSDGAPFRVDVDGLVVNASSFVVGIFDRPALTAVDGAAWGVQVDLDAAAAFALTGGQITALTNRATPLTDVMNVGVDRVLERLAASSTTTAAAATVAEELASALAAGPTLSPQVRVAWDLVHRAPSPSVAAIAERVGWTRGHLVKRFHAEIGLPPKSVARVARFRRALRLLDTDRPLVAIAVTAGYADQAHMTREFREFAATTPRSLRASSPEATFVQDDQDPGL